MLFKKASRQQLFSWVSILLCFFIENTYNALIAISYQHGKASPTTSSHVLKIEAPTWLTKKKAVISFHPESEKGTQAVDKYFCCCPLMLTSFIHPTTQAGMETKQFQNAISMANEGLYGLSNIHSKNIPTDGQNLLKTILQPSRVPSYNSGFRLRWLMKYHNPQEKIFHLVLQLESQVKINTWCWVVSICKGSIEQPVWGGNIMLINNYFGIGNFVFKKAEKSGEIKQKLGDCDEFDKSSNNWENF